MHAWVLEKTSSLATILEHAGFEDARVRPVLGRKSLAAAARRG